jgi:hypothetical protein
MQTLLKHLIQDGRIDPDFDDEITRGATITHGGQVVHEATAKALGIEASVPDGTAVPSPPETAGNHTPTKAGNGAPGSPPATASAGENRSTNEGGKDT